MDNMFAVAAKTETNRMVKHYLYEYLLQYLNDRIKTWEQYKSLKKLILKMMYSPQYKQVTDERTYDVTVQYWLKRVNSRWERCDSLKDELRKLYYSF